VCSVVFLWRLLIVEQAIISQIDMTVLNTINSLLIKKTNFLKLVSLVFIASAMQLVFAIFGISIAFVLLTIPLFYFYTKYESIENSKLWKELVAHYIVTILVMGVPFSEENYYFEIVNLPYLMFYSCTIYTNLLAKRVHNFSNQIINFIGVFSFYLFISVFVLCFLTVMELSEINFAVKREFVYRGLVFFLSLFSLVSYLSFSSQELVQDMGTLLNDTIASSMSDKVSDLELKEKKILNFFNNNSGFLETSFSLEQLAKEVSLTKQEVSEVINQNLNSSFYQLLAKYRIEYAKSLLMRDKNITIDAVVDECGFCSKSTFNKYFKMYVGQTPSVFRSQVA